MQIGKLTEKLNVSQNTLRTWEKDFDLQVKRDNRNVREYDPHVIEILEKIRKLKTAGLGLNTIKTVIDPPNSNSQINNLLPMENLQAIGNLLRKELSEQTELAEKYAKATYKLGQVENENKSLQEKIKLLPDPQKVEDLKNKNSQLVEKNAVLEKTVELLPKPEELENLKMELKEAKEEIQHLKQSWFKKLFTKFGKK